MTTPILVVMVHLRRFSVGFILIVLMIFVGPLGSVVAQTVTLDTSPSGRGQTIDGFGTCLLGTEAQQAWWRNLYFNDLQCSIVRMDLTPPFKAPWTGMNGTYNSPWFHNNPPLPGPETNNVRTYTGPTNYLRLYNGWSCPIPVMGTNIDANVAYFDFTSSGVNVAAGVATAGFAQSGGL
ncbi:MAG TPA: hypothetical protein VN281_21400, partial [Verrucomicrobiae bacterium]|nr:hypothetical protein [Verrucomicrobiae bacterium]